MNVELNLEETNKKEEHFARFVSYVFHPLLMPTYGFLLIFFTKNYISTFTPFNLKLMILVVTFVFTFVLPTLNALILLKMGRIRSLEMETSAERLIPYSSAALYYFALFYLFYNAEFPAIFKILILGAAISILLTLIINLKWKISAHAIGIGGLTGTVLGIIYQVANGLNAYFLHYIVLFGDCRICKTKTEGTYSRTSLLWIFTWLFDRNFTDDFLLRRKQID